MFDAAHPRSLQQCLVLLHRAPDLTFLTIEVAEHEFDLERARIDLGRLLEFFDRGVYLIGDEIIEAKDEVRRLTNFAPVNPSSFDEFVSLPRLAGCESEEQSDERSDESEIRLHVSGKLRKDIIPLPAHFQHSFDELSDGSVATRVPRDKVCDLVQLRCGIGRSG